MFSSLCSKAAIECGPQAVSIGVALWFVFSLNMQDETGQRRESSLANPGKGVIEKPGELHRRDESPAQSA